jgi:type VI secretion system protein ImpC
MSYSEENSAQQKTAIEAKIAEIDRLISLQLNEIIHHEDFQKLEASWRGLHYLVNETKPNQYLKIKVFQASKKDLLRDFERALEFDQSFFFKKIHDDIYGTFGEDPFGMLVGDYQFSNHPQDLTLLEYLSQVAAFIHAPFISALSSSMFGWEDFSKINQTNNLKAIFDSNDFYKWRNFREPENARYVGLCLPQVLTRNPYESTSDSLFNFQETSLPEKLLWGNAAYAFGAGVAKAYRESSWCGKMRGPNSDGLVEGLPKYEMDGFKQSVDVLIGAEKEKELSDLGFIPLVQIQRDGEIAFFSDQSCLKPKLYDYDLANFQSRLNTKLSYVLAMARFAHYLMAIVRDRKEPFLNRRECEQKLNQWIQNYYYPFREGIDDLEATDDEMRCRFPLSDSRIDIVEVPGNPGKFRAVAYLLPVYLLGELRVSMRMIVNLPVKIGS